MKEESTLIIKNVCKVESDPYRVRITTYKYSLEKHKYILKTLEVDKDIIPTLIRLLEVIR